MALFVTGDTHGDYEIRKLKASAFPSGRYLTKNDFVIILGDFGLVWSMNRMSDDEEYWLTWLSKKPWTTLFLDGNHENFDRLLAYPVQDFRGGQASQVYNSVWYLRRGEIFDLCGKKCFVMGGAQSIDMMWRTPGKSWWPQEVPSRADLDTAHQNLSLHNNKVDLVFSHTCPVSVKYKIPLHGHNGNIAEKLDFDDPTERRLEIIQSELIFDHWYFAHFHLDAQVTPRFTCVYDKVLQIA